MVQLIETMSEESSSEEINSNQVLNSDIPLLNSTDLIHLAPSSISSNSSRGRFRLLTLVHMLSMALRCINNLCGYNQFVQEKEVATAKQVIWNRIMTLSFVLKSEETEYSPELCTLADLALRFELLSFYVQMLAINED